MTKILNIAVPEVMNIDQCARYLGISNDTLYKYATERFVPAFKLGNRWRFKKSMVDEWIVSQCHSAERMFPDGKC
jgi:excisionase family DNA binding protein